MDAPAQREFVAQLTSPREADQTAAFDRIYEQMRAIARRYMGRERVEHTLQPTDVVNEAFLRLMPSVELDGATRDRLIGFGARAMRQVLIDHARRARAEKRGRDWGRVSLGGVADQNGPCDVELIALDEALTWLEGEDPRLAQMTEWHYFGGMTGDGIAHRLGISRATVTRELALARALLLSEIDRRSADTP